MDTADMVATPFSLTGSMTEIQQRQLPHTMPQRFISHASILSPPPFDLPPSAISSSLNSQQTQTTNTLSHQHMLTPNSAFQRINSPKKSSVYTISPLSSPQSNMFCFVFVLFFLLKKRFS